MPWKYCLYKGRLFSLFFEVEAVVLLILLQKCLLEYSQAKLRKSEVELVYIPALEFQRNAYRFPLNATVSSLMFWWLLFQ